MTASEEISDAFPFESKFVEVNGQQIHYVEKGEGKPILFLHGNPTSSYLWRNIIPHAAEQGRAIAMDLIGMGKSDQPDLAYRFADHVPFVDGFIEKLGLEDVTLVIHDWGSALGFHYARRNPDNIRGIAFMEGIIRPVKWSDFPPDFKIGFKLMRTPGIGWLMISGLNSFVNKVLPSAVVRDLTATEMAHYRAPYPTVGSRLPLRQWPCEIPIDGSPADVHKVVEDYSNWLGETEIPMLLFHATPGGTIRAEGVEWCKNTIKNLETVDFGSGIHFLQEDNPHLIGRELSNWIGRLG
ncbi:MAG: haloalkane dehalogenase [Rhizobiaceae bacterium]